MRLQKHAEDEHQLIDFQIGIIPDSFDLIMKGHKKEYDQKIKEALLALIEQGESAISVAQLSMADGAKAVEQKTSAVIINPLSTLVSAVAEQMHLTEKKIKMEGFSKK